MNWYKHAQEYSHGKTLYIMRGFPGSGKSTKAEQLGRDGYIFSTDDFWIDEKGNYNYDPNRAVDAHAWNQERAKKAMDQGLSPIVIDNTNIEAWEPKPYVEYAISKGYDIQFAESDAPWKNDAQELAKRNTHGVPLEVIEEMQAKWHNDLTVEDILKAEK